MKKDQTNSKPVRLISVPETAKRLNCAPKSIYNQLSDGKFPIRARRHGKRVSFLEADVDKYILSL